MCGRGIKPALEEQKPAVGMERFPRQSGMAGLSVRQEHSCAGMQSSLVLDVPATRGSKQGPGLCMQLCDPGWPRPG